MKSKIQITMILAVVASLAPAVSFAQSTGEAIYKQRCLACHGGDGMANSGIGKIMRVKPVSAPPGQEMHPGGDD
jgi:mono/diheme cytochrome c family protein